MQYRKELDGFRALAVLAVIIYHANITVFGVHWFPGGLFGVDVFFVLSGFLITGIIRNQMDSNSFSFVDFYWRRAKRIVPALLTMLIVTSIVAYIFLLPDDLVKYAQSLKSTLYFGSNYFWLNEDSYISDDSIYKPLLHTWSLAVEWQFYIVFPVVVWFINKFFKQYLFGIMLALALLSLQYAQFIVPNFPDEAFYLLPSRAWELMLGGMATYFNRNCIINSLPGSLRNFAFKALPILGLFMILHSMVFMDHNILHPSFLTLIPVLGTCLFIMFSHEGELANDFFSLRPVVFIGVISYSLYLWHQPIFVFFRFIESERFSFLQFILLVTVTLILSVITLKVVESPFRKPSSNLTKLSLLVTSCFALFVSASLIVSNNGLPSRLQGLAKSTYETYKTAEFARLQDTVHKGKELVKGNDTYKCNKRSLEQPCRFKEESWITLGDSFSGQFDYVLHEMLNLKDKGLMSLSYETCPFVSENIWFGDKPECTIVNKQRWEIINNFKTKKKILLAANYTYFSNPKLKISNPIEMAKRKFKKGKIIKSDIAWKSYADNIERLISLGHEVYVIYPIPHPRANVKKLVYRNLYSNVTNFETEYSPNRAGYNRAKEYSFKLDQYLKGVPGLHKVQPLNILCKSSKCEIINESGGLYNIGNHLSYFGVKKVIDNSILSTAIK